MCEEEEEASTRLAQMQQLVRQAEFEAAERVGNLGEIPLAVAKEALVNRITLFEGAQASVFRAEWRDGEVAVKKATIREAVGSEGSPGASTSTLMGRRGPKAACPSG